MLCEETDLPKEYWDKKISKISGATGPGFICRFKFDFEVDISVEDALLFHQNKYRSIKGLSLFVSSENIWLVFVFNKFSKVEAEEPKAEFTIDGQEVSIKMDIK